MMTRIRKFASRHGQLASTAAWCGAWSVAGEIHFVPPIIAFVALSFTAGFWGGNYELVYRRYRKLNVTIQPLRSARLICPFCDSFSSCSPLDVMWHQIEEHQA